MRLPTLNHALIVMGWHVEMHEVYSSVCSFRGEGEDQGRIGIPDVKFGRAPGLDHEASRDDLERRTGERAIEGVEWRARLEADRDRALSNAAAYRLRLRFDQCSGPGGVVLASCSTAAVMRRLVAAPA